MIALLDVNVLIALLDPAHPANETVFSWFETHRFNGWATCPLTINGCVRILGHPRYEDGPGSVFAAVDLLRKLCNDKSHRFWSDDLSLLDEGVFRSTHLFGRNQVTDAYLLGLAVHHDGCLVTLDQSIGLDAVIGAEPRHLYALR